MDLAFPPSPVPEEEEEEDKATTVLLAAPVVEVGATIRHRRGAAAQELPAKATAEAIVPVVDGAWRVVVVAQEQPELPVRRTERNVEPEEETVVMVLAAASRDLRSLAAVAAVLVVPAALVLLELPVLAAVVAVVQQSEAPLDLQTPAAVAAVARPAASLAAPAW